MAKILTVLFSVILGITSPSEKMKEKIQEDKVTTYYLIRHAEKDRSDSKNRDPHLNSKGETRAIKWADVLRDIDFDAIFSTNYMRTTQTAKPIADQNKLEIKIYDASKLFDEQFEEATTGKTVLVVGHSNTTPQFVNAILGEEKYEDISDSENGALFIVQVYADGKATSQVLYIN